MTVSNPVRSESTMADTKNDSGNVRVIVRVRPSNEVELSGQRKNVVEVMNENIVVFDPKEQMSPFRNECRRRRPRDIRKRRNKDLKFAFDYVFDETSSNFEVFEQTTRTVLDGLLGGYNCSVFAYGATGAGKTHTMLGSESHPGVIYHTMIHLYKHITEMSAEKLCDVAVSYLEVYNEQIRDLLMPRGTLPIREDQNAGVIIPGLSLHKPRSAEELLHMLQFGNKNRTQHPTDANAESSRSHAVFQVFVRQRDRTANISAQVKVGKMCLVDLAGSERATVTKNKGARLREGANINRSLLALGNVINSLADQKYKGHIPYRDSKLTRLLKDSLGGNCRTIMIAAVSPSDLSYEDTYNTLKYADRAKNIRLNMKKNVLNVDFHVSRYGKIVEELRQEIAELKTKLKHCEVSSVGKPLALPPNLQVLNESLQAAHKERLALRRQQWQQETSVREIQWRVHRKRKFLQRASQLTSTQPQMLQKMQTSMSGLQRKLLNQEPLRHTLSQQLQNNTHKLQDLQSRAGSGGEKSSVASQVFDVSMQKLAVEMELNDSRLYTGYLRRLVRAQEQEADNTETLVSALLDLVQEQHTELLNCGNVAPHISSAYQNMCQLVGEWGVSWADHKEQGDHSPFHINKAIDIPLIANKAFDGPLNTNHKAMDILPLNIKAPMNSQTPTLGNPGRKIGSQAVFSTIKSPRRVPTAVSASPLTPLFCGLNPCPQPASNAGGIQLTQTTEPTVRADSSAKDNFNTNTAHGGFVSTVYAGHTPNPKILGVCSESRHCERFALVPSSALNGHGVAETCPEKCATKSSLSSTLNETFSVEDSARIADETCADPNSTVVLVGPSLVNIPTVNTLNCQSAGVSEKNCDNQILYKNPTTILPSEPGLHSNRTSHGNSDTHYKWQSLSSASSSVSKLLPDRINSKYAPAEVGEKPADENGEPAVEQHCAVRRTINFGPPVPTSSPHRVEGKSYADILKTPSPPRQPLGTLDCNSPQFQATNTSGSLGQTPKSCGLNKVYIAGPEAMDNMRRLKQTGMPSLVENFINGSKIGLGQGASKPGYMQPTKATAQRSRIVQPLSRDDSFNPRRVLHRPLAHSRSKSTSHLNRIGWRV